MPSFVPLRECPSHHQRPMINAGVTTLLGGRAVVGTEDSMAYPAAATDPIAGILRGDTAPGAMGSVQFFGKAIVTVGAAGATKGARLMPEAATGKLVDLSAAAGVNKSLVAVAEATGAADAQIEVFLNGPGAMMQGA